MILLKSQFGQMSQICDNGPLRAKLGRYSTLSDYSTFSEEAVSKSPSSMILWSGRSRESVGATPSSISFRVHVNSEKP